MTPSPCSCDLVARRLNELLDGQRQILERLEHQQRTTPPPLCRADLARLTRLLPAIAGALGSEDFTSRDLVEHAAPGLQLVLRGLSAKQVGRLLARAAGVEVGGWVVERRGLEINVGLWRVVAAVSHRSETGTASGRSGSMRV